MIQIWLVVVTHHGLLKTEIYYSHFFLGQTTSLIKWASHIVQTNFTLKKKVALKEQTLSFYSKTHFQGKGNSKAWKLFPIVKMAGNIVHLASAINPAIYGHSSRNIRDSLSGIQMNTMIDFSAILHKRKLLNIPYNSKL